jgi:transcriptional regulator with XRE-family HTH domain
VGAPDRGAGRACASCGRRLSRYNAGRYCQSCHHGGDDGAGRLAQWEWTAESGARLRELRLRRGMTQETLAGLAGISATMISMIESGTRPLNRLPRILGLAAALRVAPAEIIPGLETPAVPAGSETGLGAPESDNEGDVERRELLRLMGGVALSAPFSGHVEADALRRELDSTVNSPTTKADVAEWERATAQYSLESGVVPPALLLPELLADLEEAQLRWKEAPEPLRAPMARVCGQLSALAASNFFNSGDAMSARRYWRTALRIINLADDRLAQSQVYAFRASLALAENPSTALALAGDAISIADGTPCAGAASGSAVRAQALALLGDHRESERTLQDLTDAFSHLPEAATSSRLDGVGFSEQSMRFTEGWVHAYAGRVSDASKALGAGRSLVPDGHWIAIASWEASMAICLIRGGDPSEGSRHVVSSLGEIPPGFRQATIVRYSAVRALSTIPPGADNAPAVAEARELLRTGG